MKTIDEILKERGKTHGLFLDNARILLGMLPHVQSSPNGDIFTSDPEIQVGTWMILHKLARAYSGDIYEPDHWDDIAGYAKLCAKRCREVALSRRSDRPQSEYPAEAKPAISPEGNRRVPGCPATGAPEYPKDVPT